jgi:hypothetical protein
MKKKATQRKGSPVFQPDRYAPPLDQLLRLGLPNLRRTRGPSLSGSRWRATEMPVEWDDYSALGLGQEHIGDLIHLATDRGFDAADEPEAYAPIHAWRALGQLQAREAIEPLLPLFHELEDWDWIGEEMPQVFARIGPMAIPALAAYVAEAGHGLFPRITASECLTEIGKRHRAARAACVAPLVCALEKFAENDPTFNGFLIDALVDLDETDALPLIARAFEAEAVDETIMGDLQDVREEFGLSRASGTSFGNKFGL